MLVWLDEILNDRMIRLIKSNVCHNFFFFYELHSGTFLSTVRKNFKIPEKENIPSIIRTTRLW